ncbi:cation transport protein [Azospirillum sp. B510]|uniref:gamma-glutamylcyclotransferase n=1 Tax=Azospirillum sp. (strain B510) TaxID=137722 RepID=UPI0001C4C39E|nr:gamma-glutamylcyclotransferase [Azospirillum sp. B510]BAI72582.1 cation transport protein [Azospirillum sp. B510]
MAPDSPLPPAAWIDDIAIEPGADLWVFGYGSLMWDPGFPYVERLGATLPGYHRSFCVASHRYRGTPERPGLVLGLDRGGACRGLVFRVAAADVPSALDYLWDREMVNRVYRPRMLRVRLRDGRSEGGLDNVRACCFIVDRDHPQYCPGLDESAVVCRIAGCRGQRGPNIEYLANTVRHLEDLGIHDARLSKLYERVRGHPG